MRLAVLTAVTLLAAAATTGAQEVALHGTTHAGSPPAHRLATVDNGHDCGERRRIVDRLAREYGETQTARGLSGSDGVMEVFASPDSGTWTILLTLPTGETCLIAAGEYWDSAPSALARSRHVF